MERVRPNKWEVIISDAGLGMIIFLLGIDQMARHIVELWDERNVLGKLVLIVACRTGKASRGRGLGTATTVALRH